MRENNNQPEPTTGDVLADLYAAQDSDDASALAFLLAVGS